MVNLQDLIFYKALSQKIDGDITPGDMTKEIFDPTSEVETSGGISQFVKTMSGIAFVIQLSENSHDSTYVSDKTYEEINAAYQAHRIMLVLVNGSALFPLLNAEFSNGSAGFTFGYTQVRTDGSSIVTRAIHYLHDSTQDVWSDSDMTSEPLLLTGGILDGTLNMASNMITNIQKLHINGEAPIFIGSTIEPVHTPGVRISGTTDGEAAVLSPYSHTTYRPIRVGEPTKNEHAVPKNFIEEKLSDKVDKITALEGQLKAYCVNGNRQDQCVISNAGLANSIARYTSSGHLIDKNAPTEENHLVNRKYVDGKMRNPDIQGDASVSGKLSVTGFISTPQQPVQDVDVVNKGFLKEVLKFDESTGTLDITI